MAFNVIVNPSLVWDNCSNQMVSRKEVVVQIIGNRGSIYAEEGPLYAQTGQEIFEAVQALKGRLMKNAIIDHQNAGSNDLLG